MMCRRMKRTNKTVMMQLLQQKQGFFDRLKKDEGNSLVLFIN